MGCSSDMFIFNIQVEQILDAEEKEERRGKFRAFGSLDC